MTDPSTFGSTEAEIQPRLRSKLASAWMVSPLVKAPEDLSIVYPIVSSIEDLAFAFSTQSILWHHFVISPETSHRCAWNEILVPIDRTNSPELEHHAISLITWTIEILNKLSQLASRRSLTSLSNSLGHSNKLHESRQASIVDGDPPYRGGC